MSKCQRFKMSGTLSLSLIMLVLFSMSACKKDEFAGEIFGECPVVVTTDPLNEAVDVIVDKVISATFNTAMNSKTINKSSFTIMQGTSLIAGEVAPTSDNATFTFTPDVPLLPFTVYTGTITTAATDTLHTAMEEAYVWTFTTIPQILVSSSPAIGGATAGGGNFAQSSLVELNATANDNYIFVNWTENDTVVSSNPIYEIEMSGNKTLVANYAPIPLGKLAVNLSANPAAGGTTIGAGAYDAGTLVSITAVPTNGYSFVNWTSNGVEVSKNLIHQFTINESKTFTANFALVPLGKFAVNLSANPTAGGTTLGAGTFDAGTLVSITAVPTNGYSFVNWTSNGVEVSKNLIHQFTINKSETFIANFALLPVAQFTVNLSSNPAAGGTTVGAGTYNVGTLVSITAAPNSGYSFVNWASNGVEVSKNLTHQFTINKNEAFIANFTLQPGTAIGPKPINLGSAGDFSILTKSGISNTGTTSIEGDIGVSPIVATAITAFGLIMNTDGTSSSSPIVTGKVYASDYSAPTPAKLTTAISDMETAFTTANGLTTPAPIVDLYAGNISGKVLPAGLYKYSTGVLISNEGVTLSGGPNDVWVFQIAQGLTVNSSAKITLIGGAQAKNIFWIVSGIAALNTNVDFSGNILGKTGITLKTGTKVKGKLLAQTSVTLDANIITKP